MSLEVTQRQWSMSLDVIQMSLDVIKNNVQCHSMSLGAIQISLDVARHVKNIDGAILALTEDLSIGNEYIFLHMCKYI